MDHERATDRWLKWMAVLGPILGVMFGLCSGSVVTYQAFRNQGDKITLLESWKEKQEEFNKVVIGQIATINAMQTQH